MDESLIAIQNPWWAANFVLERDQHLAAVADKPYFYAHPLIQALTFEPRDIHILRGARQVGKTTLVKQWIARLIHDAGVNGSKVLYLSCEAIDDYALLLSILTAWCGKQEHRPNFVFLDEISFVPEWQRAILACINAGIFTHTCLVATGSNARDLKESGERFPGRRGKGHDIELHPLSPVEFREMPCFKGLSDMDLLDIYLKVGGFPHAIRDYYEQKRVTDETYKTYQNWIVGDAAHYQLSAEILRQIMLRIAETCSTRVTWPDMIKHTPVRSHETALAYTEHLEDAFLCKVHYCYDEKRRGPTTQKARKIFFVDPLLYYLAEAWGKGTSNIWDLALIRSSDSEFRGKLLESIYISCIARRIKPIYFWYSAKAGKEVDLLMPTAEDLLLYDCKLSSGHPYKALNRSVEILRPQDFMPFMTRSR